MTRQEHLSYFIRLHRTGLTVTLLCALIVLYPLVQDNPYTLGLSNLVAIHVIVVLGLNLFIGYAGQISLGHAAFFGLGAYGSAIGTVTYELSPWPTMFGVAVLVALLALIIGVPTLRLSGHYLAMATLGFNLVVYTVLQQWDEVTGGVSGFYGIPSLAIGNFVFDDEVRFHYLVWAMALLSLLLCLNLVRSGVGRGLAALAGDETAAAALGVNTQISKVKVFVLSAVLASVAGSLYAHCYNYISPASFDIFVSTDLVIMVVIGGMGSIWGSLFGATLITLLPEWIDVFESYKDFVHGGILVLVLMFLPQGFVTGLVDLVKTRQALRRSRHAAS
ncbi:branched-chain amino acid ABC transporter permease [Desulfuromonas acetoxidans]|uniref:Inner-membrane translocator n=1 Tax=Desulfuromonas acetoxidans (strain DSM 684 / 11070) TaxID=281689 RepID=Q1JXT6_DESA6|nr:branched-chain amino acid ABC transporter permease [Desulfuromonas acetoxidans]EAT15057.1 inner-membrane translocator [Desulfuromonas acetoxidans DSM 684]MBF0647152.1 branched-chain amino acid ABC transporter permease [Desulfuromonas acetoxidans]NVD24983.1 branched-chain amino acid ABC transporter permease [Desulfuromonas acetoxidans]NVE15284.1 branched-chain amino acid ABC transporter permease [Desulfuromonas acetoxidans]